ncbi:Bug family tripartite tricarboxylate transporter substrate binding protein [Bordetella genomosp. 12]|uniref:ABC transporter substrate-binding protein n=1 Tax=Bordetella genomosp. 12 TaxID=463035 RepID=A0A261VU83_9BORD|nr:tripartite tricarboxylate transporter substrate binding protein [Bordetella genomosp. 12]OZI77666.1 ABC transporter substrate-binding protein [Bordetella genomosp. 12]
MKRTKSRAALWAASIVSCMVFASPSSAETWPSRSINMIVPFPAGGGADTLARLMAGPIMQELGQTIVIENRPGAGGNIGSATASRAEPNGYTLAYATNGTQAINHWLYKNTGFSRTDFEPISRLTTIAAAVVVNPDEPYQNLTDLLAAARAKPGVLTCGSAGNGTTSHLACELLKQMTGVNIVHIPYKGGAAAMTDLMGGRLSLLIDVMPNVAPQIKAKRLRALAVTTDERLASNPDIPTVAEAGVPGYSFFAWDALYAPKGTPSAVLDKMNATVRKVLADPTVRAQLEERGAQPAPTTREGLRTFSNEEYERLGKLVRASGAVID